MDALEISRSFAPMREAVPASSASGGFTVALEGLLAAQAAAAEATSPVGAQPSPAPILSPPVADATLAAPVAIQSIEAEALPTALPVAPPASLLPADLAVMEPVEDGVETEGEDALSPTDQSLPIPLPGEAHPIPLQTPEAAVLAAAPPPSDRGPAPPAPAADAAAMQAGTQAALQPGIRSPSNGPAAAPPATSKHSAEDGHENATAATPSSAPAMPTHAPPLRQPGAASALAQTAADEKAFALLAAMPTEPGAAILTETATSPEASGVEGASRPASVTEPVPSWATPLPASSHAPSANSGAMQAGAPAAAHAVAPMPVQPPDSPARFVPRIAPAQQVAPVAIALALGGGPDGRIALSLDPVELGRVEVVLERIGESTHVQVAAERPETLALLARDGASLDRALGGAGIGTEGGRSLSFSLLGGDAGGGNAAMGGGAQDGSRQSGGRGRGTPPAAPMELDTRRQALLGLLDIAI